MQKTIIIAIGGNSLIQDNEKQTLKDQWECVVQTCREIVRMYNGQDKLLITHGNGPQVGFILLRSEHCKDILHTIPLDICGADTQGSIGYQIQQCLQNEFQRQGLKKDITTVITQVVVDKNDPGFSQPTKPIGIFYTEQQAEKLQKEKNWQMMEDANRGYRRVVASPKPLEVVQSQSIRKILDMGNVVVACGGGGIPVTRDANGILHSCEAVIDKDLASALLATKISADILIISTAVEKVAIHFATPQQKNLNLVTVAELKTYVDEGHFAPGSMLPKIQAAIQYLENGGKKVIITKPECLADALQGNNGTHIVPE
ncbi:carbamate kinase [Candidatus Uabimicrobium amorphum]|uniref:Carbamate kinase n=1 Tax=Uabimicrobium amorphum TaxID=2596890 RepID=A0A5S9F348_UABAM|nr:carbamate kinase [Candidatus Uabimicrobium amorphum]BBM84365.1 carbamate kinase [Candidatus Uabimicrobium amorphum]